MAEKNVMFEACGRGLHAWTYYYQTINNYGQGQAIGAYNQGVPYYNGTIRVCTTCKKIERQRIDWEVLSEAKTETAQ